MATWGLAVRGVDGVVLQMLLLLDPMSSLGALLGVELLGVKLHRDGMVVLRLRLGVGESVRLLLLVEVGLLLLELLLLLIARGRDGDREGGLARGRARLGRDDGGRSVGEGGGDDGAWLARMGDHGILGRHEMRRPRSTGDARHALEGKDRGVGRWDVLGRRRWALDGGWCREVTVGASRDVGTTRRAGSTAHAPPRARRRLGPSSTVAHMGPF